MTHEQIEKMQTWIEDCLDGDAHNSNIWKNPPLFKTIQDVAELMAPRIIQRETTAYNQGREDALIEIRNSLICNHAVHSSDCKNIMVIPQSSIERMYGTPTENIITTLSKEDKTEE